MIDVKRRDGESDGLTSVVAGKAVVTSMTIVVDKS
jgi:hypothetical protein